MTYKVGTFDEFMQWTKHVVTNPGAAKDAPRQWFDSEETAAKAARRPASAEALVKLLPEDGSSFRRRGNV